MPPGYMILSGATRNGIPHTYTAHPTRADPLLVPCWRVGGTPLCAGAPCGVVPPCGPPAVLCVPLWWARAPCAAPPLRWFLAPCAGAPPRCCGPDRDHCYDRLEATAPHRIHSLAPWTDQESGHPHAYGSCVRRAGTVHAVIHSPQQAFSQQSSGGAASRSRSHSSATNTRGLGCIHRGTGIQVQPAKKCTAHSAEMVSHVHVPMDTDPDHQGRAEEHQQHD